MWESLNDEEKTVIFKESTEGTSVHFIVGNFRRHVETVRWFLRDPSPIKKWSDYGSSKNARSTDLRIIMRKSHGKRGQKVNTCLLPLDYFMYENNQMSHPRDYGFQSNSFETDTFNAPSQKFEDLSTWRSTWVGFCSLTRPGRILTDLTFGKMLEFISEISVTIVYDDSKWRSYVVGWYPWRENCWISLGTWSFKAIMHSSKKKKVLDSWLENILLSIIRNLVLMHENALSYSARATKVDGYQLTSKDTLLGASKLHLM